MNCYDDLVYRGLIKDMTNNEDFIERLNAGGMTFYWGTDPTADSLHIGHYSSLLTCKRLAKYGHHPILLVGGATGLIGDPRPTGERSILAVDTLNHNLECLSKQVKSIVGEGTKIVNNYDWTKDMDVMTFLRDVGKYVNINYMLDKDIIKRRLETGITFAEFAYTLLQGYDFYYLFEHENCIMQAAGQDQWGNITTGVDLIYKKTGKNAYAFTMPLILDANGKKIGKSEGNALWLDKEKTSPYTLYQFYYNTPDSKVEEYLKVFTFLTKEEIESCMEAHLACPEKHLDQKTLAYEFVKELHGEEEANKARETSEKIFRGEVSEDMPSVKIKGDSMNILDILVESNLCPSKSEARRLVEQGGIVVDDDKISDPSQIVDKKSFILHKGKKKIIKIEVE
ncbi:MAG TPA: tyrosine--tRNA ligase [Bacilli bacterium]|nr:tyrosine--tRNA ligase [Bacilli bacterium]